MVFTSIPLYLDPPLPNWHQPTPLLGDANDPQLQQQLPIQTSPAATSIRPGSMADRARLAKIPQPETALKCPRCDSTNTKFCYFNNYSLSQPRHLCKTCRRYWTRGGALRNVPVGGGSRRNKRMKSCSSNKSPASSSVRERNSTTQLEAPAGQLQPQPELRLPFMAGDLHHLNDQYSAIQPDNVGLSYVGIQASGGSGTHNNMEFHIGAGINTGSVESVEHWRLPSQTQQVPFYGGLEAPSTMYPFNGVAANSDQMLGSGERPLLSNGLLTQMAPVKMEETHSGMVIMNKNFLGIPGQDQYWSSGGNAWSTTDLTAFPSSSTTHML